MTGFNLPPGCNVSDIPGNRPEDGVWEELTSKFWDSMPCTDDEWTKFEKAKLSDKLMDIVDKAIQYGMDIKEAECQKYAEMNKQADKQEVERLIENFKKELFKNVYP